MPRARSLFSTAIFILIDSLIFFVIPYLLVATPGANSTLSLLGINAAALQAELATFGLLAISLTLIMSFTRRGTIINLLAGVALYSVGLAFFFYLGSINSAQPRLGFLTFITTIDGSPATVTSEFFWLALTWVVIALLKSVNHILGFIDARRSRSELKLPLPPHSQIARIPR